MKLQQADAGNAFDSSSKKGYYIVTLGNREQITHYKPKDN